MKRGDLPHVLLDILGYDVSFGRSIQSLESCIWLEGVVFAHVLTSEFDLQFGLSNVDEEL